MRLYKLFTEESDWEDKNTEVENFLGIPNSEATVYADVEQVQNPASDDFEKYLFPVIQDNQWDCIELFDASELVPWNNDWDLPLT